MECKWSRNELIAYIFLFAAHSDLKEDNHERNVIISKVDMNTFQRIHEEFDTDNDYQSLQKIQNCLSHHQFSSSDINVLMAEIKSLFLVDGNYDIMEKHMYNALQQILR